MNGRVNPFINTTSTAQKEESKRNKDGPRKPFNALQVVDHMNANQEQKHQSPFQPSGDPGKPAGKKVRADFPSQLLNTTHTATDASTKHSPIMESYQEEHSATDSVGQPGPRNEMAQWAKQSRTRFTNEFMSAKQDDSIATFQPD